MTTKDRINECLPNSSFAPTAQKLQKVQGLNLPSCGLQPIAWNAQGFNPSSGSNHPIAWIASEGGSEVVKVAASLCSYLKEYLKDSFVVTLVDFGSPEPKVESWLSSKLQVGVLVKRLRATLM